MGDVHVLALLIDSAGATPTLPGWMAVRSDAASNFATWLAWRREDGAGFAELTWTGSLYAAARVLCYQGCRTRGIPVGGSAGQANLASANVSAPSITPGRAASMLLFAGTDDAGNAVAAPSGYTNRAQFANDVQWSEKALSSGAATGTVTGTHASNRSIGQLLVLIPEADPGPSRSLMGAGW